MSRFGWAMAIGLIAACSAAASAQTISLAVDYGGTYVRAFDMVPLESFDVVTLIDTGGVSARGAEWVQTDLSHLAPGILNLGTVHHCGTCDWFHLLDPGEHIEPFAGCYSGASEIVALRVTYFLYTAEVADLVLTIRGFEPGDSQPSSFDGSPGFLDCDYEGHPLTMQGGQTWQTGSGVVVPSGALVLNPTPPVAVGALPRGISRLKGMHR